MPGQCDGATRGYGYRAGQTRQAAASHGVGYTLTWRTRVRLSSRTAVLLMTKERPMQFIGRERRRVAAIVVDDEEPGATSIQQRRPDVGRDARCLLAVTESVPARSQGS